MEWNLQLELNKYVRICCGCSREIHLRIEKRFSVHSNWKHLGLTVRVSNERYTVCAANKKRKAILKRISCQTKKGEK